MGADVDSFPNLPATSWAVLGMLSFGEELTGNELKKWADWSIGFFYWSPSVSQIYGELKKLEDLSLVQSRLVADEGVRNRRLYRITEDGLRALRNWSRDADVDMPVLKHGVMLRLWMGHLHDPEQLKRIVRTHIDNLRERARRAGRHADRSDPEPGWSFTQMSLRWSQRYFEAEIELAEQLLADIDAAAEHYRSSVVTDEFGLPVPRHPGSWRAVGADDPDAETGTDQSAFGEDGGRGR
ncbi:PadR family transcriptional regulator [Nocardia nova]|uniref:PadR family transcriptional regulator n=1 Tax=Nocardia nova TaxID=37330 RepID=UPI0018931C74|nr:PadR family transcriptional regulator [Nocardia nova]MBF6148787.1 PadR family transcriptional regulator [Nocardia nova]MDN2497232.1 PadR family transcriptional regulator [Nocardia nova]